MKIPPSRWKVLCPLCIEFKKGLDFPYNGAQQVFHYNGALVREKSVLIFENSKGAYFYLTFSIVSVFIIDTHF